MKIQELTYARIKLPSCPNGRHLHISNDCKSIFYYQKNKKVHVMDTSLEFKYNFDFLQPRLVTDGSNEKFKILLNVDIDKLNALLRKPYYLNGRKYLFDIIKVCHNETIMNYIATVIANLYEKIFINTDISNDFYNWALIKESNNIQYYHYPSNIYNIGNYNIDFYNGQFLHKTNMKTFIKFNGGIIYDKTYLWIDEILKLPYYKNTLCGQYFVRTKCTLIICDKLMCNYWLSKIKSYPTYKVKVIQTSKEHKNIIYEEILDLDYIIVSYDFLVHKNYMTLLGEYNINNNCLDNVIKIIKTEYGTFENIKNNSNIILSLIQWNRIIIDGTCIDDIIKNNLKYELITTMKADKKWIHLDNMPYQPDEILKIFNILFNSNSLSSPVYNSDGSYYYLENTIYIFKNKKLDINIQKKCINVKTNILENQIIKYSNKHSNIDKLYEYLDTICKNTIDIQDYINILNKNNIKFNIDKEDCLSCSICFNQCKQEDMFFTKCGHYYCIPCILESMTYNSTCPLCRHDLNFNNLYYLDNQHQNYKINELFKLIQTTNDEIYIYTNTHKHKKYLINRLQFNGITKKINWFSGDYNRIQMQINNNVNRFSIFLYDIYHNIGELKEILKTNELVEIIVFYFIYDICKK